MFYNNHTIKEMKISEVYFHSIRERMRVLSIDVGIKNLALCVFDINNTSGSFDVHTWKTVNLLSTESNGQPLNRCTCMLQSTKKKSNAVCGKNAKYTDPCFSEREYCEKHAKLIADRLLPSKEKTVAWWKKHPVAAVAIEYDQLFGRHSGEKHPKKEEMIEKMAKYYAERTFVPIGKKKEKSAKEVGLVEVGYAVKRALSEMSDIDCVIIENQISTIAARMKTIQGMIAQTFIMSDKPVRIEFVSSSNKLKGFDGNQADATSGTKAKYNANKMDGVKICREFIAKNEEMAKWLEMFESSKKKDDLADCFLQGIWFLKTQKYITHAENLRINSVKIT